MTERVTCTTCAHYRAGACHAAKRAQLLTQNRPAPIGRDFAALAQWCNGHKGKA